MKIRSVKKQRGGGYTVVLKNGVQVGVPEEKTNRHYRMVKAWIKAGKKVEPADKEAKPDPREIEVVLKALRDSGAVSPRDLEAARASLT